MPLTLTIRNCDQLENGSPLSLVLDRRGAIIGRAPTSDWCLPDPSLHISSRHCEIACRDGNYIVTDVSTNGTCLNGSAARLPGPHTLQQGDILTIGHYEIAVSLDGQAMAAPRAAAPAAPAWKGWDAGGSSNPVAPPASASQWDAPPAASAISGTGPMSQNWAAPRVDPAAAHRPASSWAPASPPQTPASGWSSAIPAQAPPPSADDVWGKIAASNVVDWARGGFGIAATPAFQPAPSTGGTQPADSGWSDPGQPLPQAPASPLALAPPPPAASLAPLIEALGLQPGTLHQDEPAILAQAGALLRRIVAGLVVMLEARARAKSQMGAAGTSLEFDGNNPLKFARTPEEALRQLLNPPDRGFMSADRAVEDAFRDLQAHQMATLKAMQGALGATLDRFSPTAIRSRATKQGALAKILPGSRDAALWKTYVREFGGVAQGSDEAFMDMFAKEFRKAYEELSRSNG